MPSSLNSRMEQCHVRSERTRLRWSPGLRAGSVPPSPNALPRTVPASRSPIPGAPDDAAHVVDDIEAGGGKAIAIQADATDAAAVQAAVDKVVSAFGRLDILVNNAGTAIPKPFEETTLEEMDQVVDLNVRGLFIATQAALKHFRRRAASSRSAPASASG